MNLNTQQQQWLKDYLGSVLVYSETYAEVYDHMILALENKPQGQFFETAVIKIVDEEFGGSNGLMKLEEECKNAIDTEMWKHYFTSILTWFKFPYLPFTGSLMFALYYLSKHSKSAAITIIISLLLMLFLPVLLFLTRFITKRFIKRQRKQLVRDSFFRQIAFYSFWVIWSLSILNRLIEFIFKKAGIDVAAALSYVFVPLTITLIILQGITALKLYRNEFKTSIVGLSKQKY